MFTAAVFMWRYHNQKNKKIIEKFISENNVQELGKFKCYVDKNFLSPQNRNYAFNYLELFKIQDSFLICPEHDYYFKTTTRLNPFILNNKIGRYKNLDVNKIVEIRSMNDSTYIKIRAKYNTKIELQIYEAGGIFDKVV